MTYFTLSSPFVHYLLPDSSVRFILKTGGAENSVHACRRRYAPSRTDQNARKNGIFVHCPYLYKGVVHFSHIVVLLWCLSTKGDKNTMEETVSIARLFSNDKQTLWIKAVYLSIVFADISKKICHTIGSIFYIKTKNSSQQHRTIRAKLLRI